jgi:hypothetical protein
MYGFFRKVARSGSIPTEVSWRSGESAFPNNGLWENSTVLSVGFYPLDRWSRD